MCYGCAIPGQSRRINRMALQGKVSVSTGTLFSYEWKAKGSCFITNRDFCSRTGTFSIKSETKNPGHAWSGVMKDRKDVICDGICVIE